MERDGAVERGGPWEPLGDVVALGRLVLDLEAALAERDGRIEALEAEVRRLRRQVAASEALRERLRSREGEIADLKARLGAGRG